MFRLDGQSLLCTKLGPNTEDVGCIYPAAPSLNPQPRGEEQLKTTLCGLACM